jgi:hypothetical protein
MVIIKSLASAENWLVFDNMRGWIASSSGDRRLFPNLSNDESGDILGSLQPNGFKVDGNTTNRLNANGENYIYLAIRRGPMRKPESGSDMFAMDTQGGTSPSPPAWNSGWPVDVVFDFDVGGIGNKNLSARLIQNKFLVLNDYQSESTLRGEFDYQNGYSDLSGTNSSNYAWMFRRYPGVLDVVTYEGDGNTGRTVPHNLGVVPEMLVVKNRDDESPSNWCVYHKGLDVDNDGAPETDFIYLNLDLAASDNNTLWNDTAPTETEFTLKTQNQVNSSGDNYIALLFATLDGISKVGSYTGTGSPLTIDCGFSNGAAFVWIKRWDSTGDWILFDSTRGIVSGNEPYLQTNTNNAQVTGNDYIDPDSSGFIVNGGLADINANGGEYIFLAIAA